MGWTVAMLATASLPSLRRPFAGTRRLSESEQRQREASEEWLTMSALERTEAITSPLTRDRYIGLPASVLLSDPAPDGTSALTRELPVDFSDVD